MFFNLISKENYYNPFLSSFGTKKLYFPFTEAVEKSSPNFLNEKINDFEYWTEDIDKFIKKFLKKEFKKYRVEALIEPTSKFEFSIEADNEMICLSEKTIYSFDKIIALYFNENEIIADESLKLELLLKSRGAITYSLNDIIEKLKEYFKSDYKYYLPVIFNLLKDQEEVFSSSLFENILSAKHYLQDNKIYNVKSELELKKDSKGKYLQNGYSEGITGRLMPNTNSLQTLSKEKRDIVTAEPNCYLIDFDFDAFEYNILLDILKLPKPIDPHIEIINYLGIKAERKIGKSINYSFLYGMNPKRIIETINEEYGILIDEKKLISHPVFLKSKEINININNGIIKTYFGRPLKIEKEYAVLNNYIQGTAADIFFKKFNGVLSILPKNEFDKIILQNHDSLLFQLQDKTISTSNILDEIISLLKSPIDIFSFGGSIKYGKEWGSLI